jgi:hypothetical protein
MITFLKLGEFGRLGNQLFQIASTIGIAAKNNTSYVFPTWKYSHFFENEIPQSDEIIVQDSYYERAFTYQSIHLGDDVDWNLSGFFSRKNIFSTVVSSSESISRRRLNMRIIFRRNMVNI